MFSCLKHVHQFNITLSIQHEILRLQVSVEDTFAMEVVKSLCDATNTEFGSGLIKTPPADTKTKFKHIADRPGQILRCSGRRSRRSGLITNMHLNPLTESA